MQRELLGTRRAELHLDPARLVGSAPLALESALRALAGCALTGAGVEISLRSSACRPRDAVVGLGRGDGASASRSRQYLAPHQIAALTARIPGALAAGPYALASAAARVVEALAHGSRRRFTCFVALGRGQACRHAGGDGSRTGSLRIVEPALSRQEQTLLDNALEGEM